MLFFGSQLGCLVGVLLGLVGGSGAGVGAVPPVFVWVGACLL